MSTISSARVDGSSAKPASARLKKELGDFQTPLDLALTATRILRGAGDRPARVLEPTCGTGAFLRAAVEHLGRPLEIFGIEIQARYVEEAREVLHQRPLEDVEWRVQAGDIFSYDLAALPWRTSGPLLVLGNPPWITLAELGAMNSGHIPQRSNVRSVRGIDALTGDSNFDVAEYIWMRLLTELREESPTIAMLCKTSVARRVLVLARRLRLPVAESALWRIDAQRSFGVAADAGLFMIRLDGAAGRYDCKVYESFTARAPVATMGIVEGGLVADVVSHQKSRVFDGRSPIEWRQGVKHDASKVLELKRNESGGWRNGLAESVEVEADWTFPLTKGSDIYRGREPSRRVIVTQRSLGENPRALHKLAPRLWNYLQQHEDHFARRKSSVYRSRPQFSMFGIGPYTFSPWKVAVCSLWKEPRFRVLPPSGGQPILCDDTSYFLPCSNAEQAAIVAATLRSEPARCLLKSLVFVDAKRVVTKALLQRVDLYALFSKSRGDVLRDADRISAGFPPSGVGELDLEAEADSLLRQWSPAERLLPFGEPSSVSSGLRVEGE